MRNILFILAALVGFGAFAQTNIPTRIMLADSNGVVKMPTNITRIRIGGTDYTNLLGFGLSVTNDQLSVDTTQLPSGGGSGVVTSVTDDFEIDGGELALTNALGTGPLVRQSAASGVGTVTSVGASTTVSGLGFSGTPVTGSGTLSLTGVVAVASGGTGGTDAATARSNLGVLSSRWLTGFGSPSDYSEGIGTYYVNLETYQVWEQTGVSTFETIPFFVMGEGVYSYLDQPNTFASTNTFAAPVVLLSGISGNGTLLTNLNGTEIRSGTVAAARIDSAMATDAEVTAATAEATLEAVLDLQDLQGAVTDAQVPNTITVDLATTATTANAGDSATAFFSSGEIEDARLPPGLSRDAEVAATYAPLASPALTGAPTVPTASAASSNTVAASTAYVDRAVASGGGGGGGTWDGTPIASGTITNLTVQLFNSRRTFLPAFGGFYADGVFGQINAGSTFYPLVGSAIASGTAVYDVFANVVEDPYQRILISSSTTTNSGYVYRLTDSAYLLSGNEYAVTRLYIAQTNLSSVRAGFVDVFTGGASGGAVDGAYLELSGGLISGVTANNSSRTTTTTSFTPIMSNTNMVDLEVVVGTGATNVVFNVYTNKVIAWTDSLTNNIPTGAGRYTAAGVVATYSGTPMTTNLIYLGGFGVDRSLKN